MAEGAITRKLSDGRVCAELAGWGSVELDVPLQLRELAEPGKRVVAYIDRDGRIGGWHLSGHHRGVDLREESAPIPKPGRGRREPGDDD